MISILNEYKENGEHIIEYTKDGKSISHKLCFPVQDNTPIVENPPQPTLEDKINYIYYTQKGVI